MKQQITKEQWDEIDKVRQTEVLIMANVLRTKNRAEIEEIRAEGLLTIGQLIEFLDAGDVERDEDGIAKDREAGDFEEIYSHWRINNNEVNFYWKGELISALWEATKYKLKNN